MRNLAFDKRGQFVIEGVLLMVVTVGAFLWATNQIREGKYLAKLIGGPWEQMSGMIEAGVWKPPGEARALHPNQIGRSSTVRPDR